MYQVACRDCDKVYFGETGRELQVRFKEHKRDIGNLKPESGMAVHSRDTGHCFDFVNGKFVFLSKDISLRHLVESALIVKFGDKCVNLNKGFSPHNALLSDYISSLIKH